MSENGKPGDWPSGLQHAGLTSGAERGAGTPIPERLRQMLEAHLGADLSGVRVHTNSAVVTALGSDAQAFTTGQDVFFRSGAYNPYSADGKRLLAHELTHAVQPSASVPLPNPSPPGPAPTPQPQPQPNPGGPSPIPTPYPTFRPRPPKQV